MLPLSKHWLYLINATFTVSWRILTLHQVLNRVRSHLIGGTWRPLWSTTGSGGESVDKYESNHVIPFHFLALSGSKEPSLLLSPPREMLQRRPCHVLLPWIGGKIVTRDLAVASCGAPYCRSQNLTFWHVLLNQWYNWRGEKESSKWILQSIITFSMMEE